MMDEMMKQLDENKIPHEGPIDILIRYLSIAR